LARGEPKQAPHVADLFSIGVERKTYASQPQGLHDRRENRRKNDGDYDYDGLTWPRRRPGAKSKPLNAPARQLPITAIGQGSN
jgi:hypothetical protein